LAITWLVNVAYFFCTTSNEVFETFASIGSVTNVLTLFESLSRMFPDIVTAYTSFNLCIFRAENLWFAAWSWSAMRVAVIVSVVMAVVVIVAIIVEMISVIHVSIMTIPNFVKFILRHWCNWLSVWVLYEAVSLG